jgi:ADP-ribosyl-[dinitrogen reductase] hydrolase
MIPLLEKIEGCLVGLAIGDSMGFPFETCSQEEIKSLFVNGAVDNYVSPQQEKLGDTGTLPAGSFTDDTQLSLAVIESIIDSGGFNITDMALKHIAAREKSTIGWGKSTYDGVGEVKQYFESFGKKGRSPDELLISADRHNNDNSRGCGNGVAMKIAGLAILYFIDSMKVKNNPFNIIDGTILLGGMTHSDPRASLAAIAVAAEIVRSLSNADDDPILPMAEKAFCNSEISAIIQKGGGMTYQELIDKVKPGFFALESCCFAICMAKKNRNDFKTAIQQTIMAGGDTDSNASMVGAIVGAGVGLRGIPSHWILPQHEAIIPTAKLLLDSIQAGISNRKRQKIVRVK